MDDMIQRLCEKGVDFDLAVTLSENFDHAHVAPMLRENNDVETVQQESNGEKCGGLRCKGCQHCTCHRLE